MELTVFRMERRFPAEIKKAGAAAREIVDGKAKMKMIHEAFFTIFALIVAVLETGILDVYKRQAVCRRCAVHQRGKEERMTVQNLIDSGKFGTVNVGGDTARGITKPFCCDLLSLSLIHI